MSKIRADHRQRTLLRLANAVFATSNEGILITDAKARIVAVNHAFEAITGYRQAELVGRNPRFQKSGRQSADFYRDMWRQLLDRGAWQGEMWNRRRDGEVYAVWQNITAVRDDAGCITHYVSLVNDITSLKQTEVRLSHLAHHDPLTGLSNRLMFDSALDHSLAAAKRRQRRVGLLFLDLDHFKVINDTWGHAAGDKLLETIAERLRTSVRAQDTVARLGGDEFTVLVEDVGERSELAYLATKLMAVTCEPVMLEGHSAQVSSSIGIAVYPDDAHSAAELTRAADAALYRAKTSGRHNYSFYTEEMTQASLERLAIEMQLQQAVHKGELLLHYQPQIALDDGRFVGLEAFVRWQHGDAGLLLPERFVPIAEGSALIEALNQWVLEEACRQSRVWLDSGLSPLRICINLSGKNLLHGQLARDVVQALRRHGLEQPSCGMQLAVEITETALQSSPGSHDVLQALRRANVDMAIGSYGNGYSSLSRLSELPIQALNIDRRFVRGLPDDPHSETIVRAVIATAHSLGLRAVANGVETAAQREHLARLGCNIMQGFLVAGPMDAACATAWLRDRSPSRLAACA